MSGISLLFEDIKPGYVFWMKSSEDEMVDEYAAFDGHRPGFLNHPVLVHKTHKELQEVSIFIVGSSHINKFNLVDFLTSGDRSQVFGTKDYKKDTAFPSRRSC